MDAGRRRLLGPGRVAAPLALAILVASCTGGGHVAPSPTGRPAPPVAGWMLAGGERFGQGLTATELPNGDPIRLGIPNDQAVLGAAWARPGRSAYAFVQYDDSSVQLVEAGLVGSPHPIGPRFREPGSLSAAGSVFLASTCTRTGGDTFAIDVTSGSAWTFRIP